MESDQYRPISHILADGSSVNGKDAFINVPGLRKGLDKAAPNKSPVEPKKAIPFMPSGKGKASIAQDIKEDLERVRSKAQLKQKKLQEQTTSTPERTTRTTTSTSTSRPSTTTTQTTMSKKTRTNNSTTRSNSNTPGNRRGDNSYHTSSTFQEPKGNPFNVFDKDTDATPFVVNGLSTNVNYSIKLDSSCLLRPEVVSSIIGNEVNPKLTLTISSFGGALKDATSNYSPYYNGFLNMYFNRCQTDVMRVTKGVIPAYWDQTSFKAALTAVTSALEYFYTLDSILSFANKSVSNLSGSRSLETYGNLFNQTDILLARDNLRRYLQGTWCPPELSMQIRSFYQYYRSSASASQAGIFRYVPSTDFINVSSTGTLAANVKATVETLRVGLTTQNAPNIIGIMSNIYPHGIINGVPRSADDAYYSEDMLEIFINEPTIFNDKNLTGKDISVVPISYASVNNDIPYYSFKNPKDMNGANFAMQVMPINASATSGNTWGTVTDYFGIRKSITYGASPNMANKFLFDANSGNMVAKTMYNSIYMNSGLDTHLVFDQATTSGTTTTYTTVPVNSAIFGTQRVYFDQNNAPATIFNILASKLFGTAV